MPETRAGSERTLDGLPPEAYETIPGEEYPPYVSPDAEMAEFTLKALVIGVVLAVVFGAANAYLGLRVGLTVSASIPAAVMAVAAFRVLRKGTILEANMVQTVGSAGESLAAGVIFTLPALFIWQRQDPAIVVDVVQISVIALFGGLLGVLFMIPLRAYLISREHGNLPYPEGTACAEVQVAGDVGGSKALLLFKGLGIGALYQLLANSRGLSLWNESPSAPLPAKARIGGDFTPELLGVGFIIGPRIAAIMFGGSAFAWLVLIPLINWWGGTSVVYPAQLPMVELSSDEIWNSYIRYVGAGAVGFGGIITLIKSLPTIAESFKLGMQELGSGGEGAERRPRTQQDLPYQLVAILAVLMALALALWPGVPVDLLGGMLIVVFSFFFVTVSSRIVGLIGSSSNPVSGMTIAALILTSLIWVALDLNDGSVASKVAVLAVGAVVCISAAIAGDSSQDLKTGFLVGATPRLQQLGEMVGVTASAAVMGWVLIILNQSYGIGTADGLPAPQATLMALVIDGVLQASLPWGFVLIGVAIAAIAEFVFKLPSLALAVGVYLPVSLMTPILVGGIMRWGLTRKYSGLPEDAGSGDAESTEEGEVGGQVPSSGKPASNPVMAEKREQGVLYASGLIAGAALIGVAIGGAIYAVTQATGDPETANRWVVGHEWSEGLFPGSSGVVGTVVFAGLCWLLWRAATSGTTDDASGGNAPA
ncbi:MAG: oligopeptide transporter, OPT family [Longimicrobiales bacterium]|nr:oligopeptide transporter, OPT family [Longimicrobiales bacterium]